MISIAALRDQEIASKQNETLALGTAYRSQLAGLKAIHRLIERNGPLSSLDTTLFDPDDISQEDAEFLNQYDLASGRPIDPTSLLTLRPPTPQSPPQPEQPSISESKPTSDSTEQSRLLEATASPDAPSQDVAVALDAGPSTLPEPTPAPAVQEPSADAPDEPSVSPQEAPPAESAPLPSPRPGTPATAPVKIAPPLPEEAPQLSDSTQQLLDTQLPPKPAKVVHLPSREVQEGRLRDREAAEEQRRQSDVESKSSQRLAAPPNEVASSPSSTVDAYSAATPNAQAQESPDTSPDSENLAQEEILPPEDLQPTAEQQHEKEEHDKILEAQKEIARKEALGDVPETPDDQLRLEESKAAAREQEERAARNDVGGPEPVTKDARESTEAERIVEEMEVDPLSTTQQTLTEVAQDDKPEVTPGQTKAASPVPSVPEEDDTIVVAPGKTKQLSRDASETPAEAERQSVPASARSERMTTRVSSGVIRQKSVSEILGRSQSPPAELPQSAPRETLSPPVSPFTQRNPRDERGTAHVVPARQPVRLPARLAATTNTALDQLDILKGAAQDPERDYLEPLFRIQAHESQNSGTRTLPELIKMVPKALSTEDHFTSLHERLDFRMLRRIYQLQNANKWSLRQMEKCKEPEQPVTHHDHMMEEMKWMRKDFRAERKLKKSVCAWLAQRCAEWLAAGPEGRRRLQVKIKAQQPHSTEETADAVPDLQSSGDSAPEDDITPPTPRSQSPVHVTVVVAPELASAVEDLRKAGTLTKALVSLPKVGLLKRELKHEKQPTTPVSKFIEGRVLPKAPGPPRKRSRYEYEDEAEMLESQPGPKRLRDRDPLPQEDSECALFQSDNKPIRDRLHSNNAFRPPSEFVMPSTSFYEFRNGSQWIWDDDQKLRKLAKDYSFNWSLIADEMALPTRYKTSAERRTPWECFERWVELETLPADMRKTVYFKTWFQRLEQSQQASEKRYQQHIQHLQQQAAQNGTPAQVPLRRRTTPTRVEKRRSTRYIWLVEGFRKLAKKREQAAWKQAETARVAAQRKSQPETSQVPKMVKMTPQEFSKKRQECDAKQAEQIRQHRAKMIEQQRQLQLARQGQQSQPPQGMPNGGMPTQQRPQPPNAAQQAQMQAGGSQGPNPPNAQASNPQQARPGVQAAPQRNGHLAPPQANGKTIPQAPMQVRSGMPAQHPIMQPIMQANAQAQARNAQFSGQQYQMPNGNLSSPGGNNFTTQQQLQQNQALVAAFQQQQQASNGGQNSHANQNGSGQQMSASPSMPPPPTPQNVPQQLSSGHVPAIIAIQNQLRNNNPNLTDDQLKAMATHQIKMQSQTSNQARQNAMNAAAGLGQQHNGVQQGYNQAPFQRNGQISNGMGGMYVNGDANSQNSNGAPNMSPAGNNSSPSSQQQAYAQKLWRQQMQMQQMAQMQSPNTNHAQLNGGSPSVTHASPNMAPASPSMQFSNMNQMGGGMGTPMGLNGQRPSSRSNTPQLQRLGSSGGMGNGMQSPGALQGSPRNTAQASMAR